MKEELEALMKVLLLQNQNVSKIMHQSSAFVKDVSTQINRITVNVQFQDRNSQIANNAVNVLKVIQGHHSGTIAPLPENPAEALKALAAPVTLSAVTQELFSTAARYGITVGGSPGEKELPANGSDVELF
jgi:hypothetical protein